MKDIFRALLLLVALAYVPSARADYHIVVSDDSPLVKLSQTEALHLFMGRNRALPDGRPAITYDLAESKQRAGFYLALAGLTPSQLNSYWARLMFSGRNLPPDRLDSEAEMVAALRADPRAIGWLPDTHALKGLRTILVLKAPP